MTTPAIPDDLRRFILTSVPSVPYLEAILLLQRRARHGLDGATAGAAALPARGARPTSCWGAFMRPASSPRAQRRSGPLRTRRSRRLAAMLERLAQLYAADLVAVTDLIHSSVDRRAFQFADAFRLRKD